MARSQGTQGMGDELGDADGDDRLQLSPDARDENRKENTISIKLRTLCSLNIFFFFPSESSTRNLLDSDTDMI